MSVVHVLPQIYDGKAFHIQGPRSRETSITEAVNGQIPLRYPASEPVRELVRELVCDPLASC